MYNNSMEEKFITRAGEKLKFALNFFNISVKDKICADYGCSHGGFTDCLLKNGAKKVYAVDTAYGTLDWKLRNDRRVIVLERTNALYLTLPEKVDFISVDVGWTRQELILPKALENLKKGGNIVALVKPQYEAKPSQIYKGTVKDTEIDKVIKQVRDELTSKNIFIKDTVKSPLLGGKGRNVEYLFWIKRD